MRLMDEGEGHGYKLFRTPSPFDRVVRDAPRPVGKPQTVGPSLLGYRWASGPATLLRSTSESRDEGRPKESDNGLPSTSCRDEGVFNGATDWAARAGRTLVGSIPKLTSRDPSAGSACCTLLVTAVFRRLGLSFTRLSA